jgi:O-antigen ligase
MIWLLGGYVWLFIHRPFEVWPALGDLQIERVYVILMLLVWPIAPNKGWTPNRMHYVTAGFTLSLLLAWFASPYREMPICSQTVEDYLKTIVFYVLMLTTVRNERDLQLLITLFLAAVGLYAAHSFREFLGGRYEYRMGIRRMNGVDKSFGDPNTFGSSLLYTVPLAVSVWMSKPRKALRVLLVCYLIGVSTCIALTGSRSSFVGMAICGTLLLLLWVRRKLLLIVLLGLGGVAALGVAAVALPPEMQNRYLTLIDSSYGPKNAAISATSRWVFFLEAIQAWQSNPLIGHGPRSFDFIGGHGMGVHNLYGQVLCEMGILGALALVAYVVCFLLNWLEIHRYYQSHPQQPRDFLFYLSRNMAIVLLLMLVLGGAGHSLYRYNWRWFAAFQAIAVYCIRQRQRDSFFVSSLARPQGPRLHGRDAALAGASG